jgi:Tfp pilus assembly protein PilV
MCRELNDKEKNIRRIRTSPGRSGFTLSEVIVASTLLIIAVVPILKGLANAHLVSSIVERKTRSLTLAQGKLDEVKARSIYNYADSFDVSNERLEASYLCGVTDTSLSSNLRKVKVKVGYDADSDNSLDPDEVEITLTTQLAKRW